jgi:peptide/nickel transport system permease protein
LAYVLRRLLWLVPTVLGITLLGFVLLRLAPGDPAELALAGGSTDTEISAEAVARFRAAYLFDQPLWKQYLHYLGPFDLSPAGHAWFGGSGERPYGGLLLLDLEHELARPHIAVRDEIARRLAVTIPHAAAALLLAYLVALPLGIWSALRARGRLERGAAAAVFALYCVPVFWGGLLLQLVFGATGLDWLPALASADAAAPFLERMRRGVLPVLALAYPSFAYLSRQMRAGLLEALATDYVRTARAKGLSERLVVLKHALPNALLPVATLFAGVVPALIGGSVVVETLFDLPGMGRYAYEGLEQRDWFIVLGTTTLAGFATCLGVLFSDLLTAALDPRIRHGG